jgi:hypothetical protein
MASTIGFKVLGPTYALSVANTAHAAVAVLPAQNGELVNYAAFLNTGSTVIAVTLAPLPASGTPTTPVLVFPVDGTPTVPMSFILPASMQVPLYVSVPNANGGFSVSAIGSAAGPSIFYVTPVVPVG